MPHVRKGWLVCDNCDEQIEIDPTIEDPFFSSYKMREENYKDWSQVEGKQILCPKCSKTYFEEKEKCDTKLKKLAGLKTFVVTI